MMTNLRAKLYRVLDLDGGGTANTVTADQLGAQEPAPVAMQRSAAPVQEDLSPPWDVDTEKEVVSGDPALSFFEKLAEEE